MTGSTPADWDPVTGGAFGPQLKKIRDSYVVMTLGANPLLSDYLRIGTAGFSLVNGPCAGSTIIRKTVGRAQTVTYAAALNGGEQGVLRCFNERWSSIRQTEHLVNVYKALLQAGNRVLVLGYPAVCPWSFGDWQTDANLVDGPAKGYACTAKQYPAAGSGNNVSQWDQSVALGTDANNKMEAAAGQAGSESGRPADIRFTLPDQSAWANHQAWQSNSWVFKNDTWIHPNAEGARQLARSVIGAMCGYFGHWCGNPPKW